MWLPSWVWWITADAVCTRLSVCGSSMDRKTVTFLKLLFWRLTRTLQLCFVLCLRAELTYSTLLKSGAGFWKPQLEQNNSLRHVETQFGYTNLFLWVWVRAEGNWSNKSNMFRKKKGGKWSLYSSASPVAIQQPVSGAGFNGTFPAYAHYVSCPFLQGSDNVVILNSGPVQHYGLDIRKHPYGNDALQSVHASLLV